MEFGGQGINVFLFTSLLFHFILISLNNISLYKYTTSLFIHLSMGI